MEDIEKTVTLGEVRAMFMIPENTCEVELECSVFADGGIIRVSKKLNMKDVQQAVADAEKNYMEDDDMFEITDKGLRYLEEQGR